MAPIEGVFGVYSKVYFFLRMERQRDVDSFSSVRGIGLGFVSCLKVVGSV